MHLFNVNDEVVYVGPSRTYLAQGEPGTIYMLESSGAYTVVFKTAGLITHVPEFTLAPAVSQVNSAPAPYYGSPYPTPTNTALSHPTTAYQFNSKYPNGATVKHKGGNHDTKRYAYTLGSGRSVVKLASGDVVFLAQLEAVEGR